MINKDLVIIGGGPAGLAAAVSAKDNGIDDILVIERDAYAGGILNQCIHNGFGLHTFKEELTGPEYAMRYIEMAKDRGIDILCNAMVTDISIDKVITVMHNGISQIQAKAIVLAMGCRERPRGALNIPGSRPAGIYSAGTAQYYVNIEGKMPGREVVILGSGDIGLIMARRMTLEGAKVKAVAEIMPYSGGLKRNIVQCLNDYNIPLLLSHTVIDIQGKERVTGVVIAEVDDKMQPIKGTEQYIKCDTLLLSVGLLPENELSIKAGITLSRVTGGPIVNQDMETDIPGIFACGNVLHVHDLVDYVSSEADNAGLKASQYLKGELFDNGEEIAVTTGNGVRYTVPEKVATKLLKEKQLLRFRVGSVYKNVAIVVKVNGEEFMRKNRKTLAPGEMEEIILDVNKLQEYSQIDSISVEVEERI